MENVMVKNKVYSRKVDRFMDTMCFVLQHIEADEDLGYCSLADYRKGADCFGEELVEYALNEDDMWNFMFKQAGVKDYHDMEKEFLNSRFCIHENLLLVEMTNGSKFCILRL